MSEADGKRKDVEFRKNVLKGFLENLKQAQERLFEDCDRLDSEHPDMSFEDKLRSLPKLQLDALWGDALEVILDGLKRACDGDEDPFRLKLPKGGAPKVSDLDRFDMAVDAFRMWKVDGKNQEAAFEDTAEQYSCKDSEISASTVRDALRMWEKLLGERLLDDKYCDQQRDLIDMLHRAETTPKRTTLR